MTSSSYFDVIRSLQVGSKTYFIHSLKAAEEAGLSNLRQLPVSLRILLENLLRHQGGTSVSAPDIWALNYWVAKRRSHHEIAFMPVRVLMQDFTGVPAIVDLAAMRDAMLHLRGDPKKINPLSQVDLVIDHSVSVDRYGTPDAFEENVKLELVRNKERYTFLKWAQNAFQNFRVVPPGTGICHQVNLEYLGKVIWTQESEGQLWAFPDSLVGTDSHTTMINGLAILGWGVGGIEAEAAMLGQPLSMLIPEVIGVKISGSLREGVTATDLVLTVTHLLRKLGVVGKFVEFFGSGLDHLSLPDRATISNMSPEYGATCCFFPIDQETLNYLALTGRHHDHIKLVEVYAKEQGLWRDENSPEPAYTHIVELDLNSIEPSIAGPARPQDKISLKDSAKAFEHAIHHFFKKSAAEHEARELLKEKKQVLGHSYKIGHGSVVIAAITSCTNTSNPSVMLAAGLVAKKAREKGLSTQPWVKTSLAPGSKVVTDYLTQTGLQEDLNALGFNLVGYGCTTCIGNSGPLPERISKTVHHNDLVVCAVLSGNRNFEGRINPDVRANYLASPPLVVAFALAGSVHIDFEIDPLGHDQQGQPVYLRDIWPKTKEVQELLARHVSSDMFSTRYKDVFAGDAYWQELNAPETVSHYEWDSASTYVRNPPYFEKMGLKAEPIQDIKGAYCLALLGDSITTDHISPAGSIKKDSPAGHYLSERQIPIEDFNSYGSRRGNHEIMMRGTFANIRLRNEMVPGIEGGMTRHVPSDTLMTIFDAAIAYQLEQIPLIVIAGKEYGSGSSRDWAAKGPKLLGVKAVVAESFERIHRSNLIGMGILPLQFKEGTSRKSLNLTGSETFDVIGLEGELKPHMEACLIIYRTDGSSEKVPVICCIYTKDEVEYYRNEGILPYVLRKLL